MLVLKFGGTSVGSAARMKHVAALIQRYSSPKIVVLSAMAGTTNTLVKIAEHHKAGNIRMAREEWQNLKQKYEQEIPELLQEEKRREALREGVMAYFSYIESLFSQPADIKTEKSIWAQGELISTLMFHAYLQEKKALYKEEEQYVLISALDFMRIDENGEPQMNEIETLLKKVITSHLIQTEPSKVTFITQGFICKNVWGEIDNLKRGGSDYSASIIGAVMGAEEIQIWTDIDGIHNNDPRYVQGTAPVHYLSFDEAAELAYFGAKILHPSTVLPARVKGIPVRLKNTMDPDAFGTLISEKTTLSGNKAVAAKDGITAIKIKSGRMLMAYGFLRKVFEIFELYKTPIDVITTSEVAVSLTIDDSRYLEEIVNELKKLGTVEVDQDLSIICIVGDYSEESKGYAYQVFDALKEVPVRMISYGGSRNNITVVVKTQDKVKALQLLQNKLFRQNEVAGTR